MDLSVTVTSSLSRRLAEADIKVTRLAVENEGQRQELLRWWAADRRSRAENQDLQQELGAAERRLQREVGRRHRHEQKLAAVLSRLKVAEASLVAEKSRMDTEKQLLVKRTTSMLVGCSRRGPVTGSSGSVGQQDNSSRSSACQQGKLEQLERFQPPRLLEGDDALRLKELAASENRTQLQRLQDELERKKLELGKERERSGREIQAAMQREQSAAQMLQTGRVAFDLARGELTVEVFRLRDENYALRAELDKLKAERAGEGSMVTD